MDKLSLWIIFCTLLVGALVDGAKILVIFPVPVKSHVVAYQPLIDELAKKGHEMTVISTFPRNSPLNNYKEVLIEDTFPPRDSASMNLFQMKTNFVAMLYFMHRVFIDSCEKILQQPNVQNLIESKDTEFDLIIYEPFLAECTYGLLHKYKTPRIQIFPNTIIAWSGDVLGNPSTTSYIPDMLAHDEHMGLTNKLCSVLKIMSLSLVRSFIIMPQMDAVMRKYFPDPSLPSIREIESNASLLFLHTHPILNHPRPLTPNTIEVGGLHIKNKSDLPKDLKKFMDEASHGVIYFSLGSNVRSVDMPIEKRNAILRSFSKLKERILWKWEENTLTGQPENVLLSKWLPQHDILAHPNTKLFITHGGLMSIQEATYFGVPLIAIPVMGDQQLNAVHAQNNGYAVVIQVQNITESSLDWSINEVLHNPSYQEKATHLSKIFQDQPQTPLERAVYWVEYVIRHKGAPHLLSAAVDLNFIEYYLLDVIAVIVLSLSVFLLAFLAILKITFKYFTKSNKSMRNLNIKKRS